MSKEIRTIDQLQDVLDSERSWRVKDLSVLRKKLLDNSATHGTDSHLALLRPCVAMIYAHWEGFVKNCCSNYLQFVALQRPKHRDLTGPFLALSARRSATEKGLSGTAADRYIINFYRAHQDSRGYLPYKAGIDTKSNLRFEIFQEIFESLDLDWSRYQLLEKLIDNQLVGKRNAIAHGQYVDLKSESVQELFVKIIDLMDEIKEQIITAASNKLYLNHSSGIANNAV